MIGIDEIMTLEPHTLTRGNSLNDARTLMVEKNIRHIPIVNSDHEVVGLVSHRDVLAASESLLSESNEQQRIQHDKKVFLESVMTASPSVADHRDSLLSVAVHLKKHRHGCMPVVKGNKLIGIISSSDLMDLAIQAIEMTDQENGIFDEAS